MGARHGRAVPRDGREGGRGDRDSRVAPQEGETLGRSLTRSNRSGLAVHHMGLNWSLLVKPKTLDSAETRGRVLLLVESETKSGIGRRWVRELKLVVTMTFAVAV